MCNNPGHNIAQCDLRAARNEEHWGQSDGQNQYRGTVDALFFVDQRGDPGGARFAVGVPFCSHIRLLRQDRPVPAPRITNLRHALAGDDAGEN